MVTVPGVIGTVGLTVFRTPVVLFPLTVLWSRVRAPLLRRAAFPFDPVTVASWIVSVP
jgi:hypothetical protein